MLKRYVANDNIIIGAQSGSDQILAAAGRGHGTAAAVRDAVRIAVECGFRPNVDFIFGMPSEDAANQRGSLALATELAAIGARIHAHMFMPLPGTPWRDAEPAFIPLATMQELDRLAQRGCRTATGASRPSIRQGLPERPGSTPVAPSAAAPPAERAWAAPRRFPLAPPCVSGGASAAGPSGR